MDDASFVRRCDVTVAGCAFRMEFDSGFLQPLQRVHHAHNHAAAEVIAVSSGTSVIDAIDASYTCLPGDVLLIPAGVYHTNSESSQLGERFCFRLAMKEPGEGSICADLYPLLEQTQVPQMLHLPMILPVLSQVRSEMLHPQAESDAMIRALLAECLIHLLRCVSAEKAEAGGEKDRQLPKATEEERMKRIDRFFSLYYMQRVTLRDLAVFLHVSPTHTNRILGAFYGQSFREKLRDTRLNQARILLMHTKLSVHRIAQEVGYSSETAFFSAFRAAFGSTPAEYRKMRREELLSGM